MKAAVVLFLALLFAAPARAGVYWMPDYVGRLGGFGYGDRTNHDDLINGGKYGSCASYGMLDVCPPQQKGTLVHPIAGLDCYKGCSCEPRYQYDSSNCKPPYYPAGASCGGKFAECQLDIEEACRGYSKTCPAGWQMESGGKCSYDESYGTCCNKCEGYDYSSIPDGYAEAGSCDSCAGKKYKVKINPCDGYYECEYGGKTGSLTCRSGTLTKYKECRSEPKSCPAGSWNLDSYWCNSALKCWIN